VWQLPDTQNCTGSRYEERDKSDDITQQCHVSIKEGPDVDSVHLWLLSCHPPVLLALQMALQMAACCLTDRSYPLLPLTPPASYT